jgi:hypothetical protein
MGAHLESFFNTDSHTEYSYLEARDVSCVEDRGQEEVDRLIQIQSSTKSVEGAARDWGFAACSLSSLERDTNNMQHIHGKSGRVH